MYVEDCEDLTRRFGPFRVMEWLNSVYSCLDEVVRHEKSSGLRKVRAQPAETTCTHYFDSTPRD